MIEDDQKMEGLSSNSKRDKENKNSKPNLVNNEHQGSPLSVDMTITTLFNKVTNNTDIDIEDSNVKQLCNLCIESKHTKIVRYKKITQTIWKLHKTHADL